VYVDNFIIFLNSLKEYKRYLRKLFERLNRLYFLLSAKKYYLSYLSAILLRQKVDALGLSITNKRLVALYNLEFLKTAAVLEMYISTINFLYNKTAYYT
ncbi:hypothetical protein CC78DRAFT_480106, partial [Lojkania enalia]